MPYITRELRDHVDPSLDRVIYAVQSTIDKHPDATAGVLNYAITRLITGTMPALKYRHINTAIGVLGCVSHELYRRLAVPYENQQQHNNGDVAEIEHALEQI